jgi:Fe-S-cluster containining protein
MIREGKCKRCGMCCEEAWRFAYLVDSDDKGELNWETARLDGDPKLKDPTGRLPCSELSYDIQTRQAICNNQSEKREVCKRFPHEPAELIFNSCGYRFVGG